MQCPKCGGDIAEGKKFCKFCGSPLSATAISSTQIPEPDVPPNCPNCGTTLVVGRAFCGRCGSKRSTASIRSVTTTVAPSMLMSAGSRRHISWFKAGLLTGIPLLLAILGATAWYRLPRVRLAPVKLRTRFDRAVPLHSIVFFNTGLPGRKSLFLVAGNGSENEIWELPSGRSVWQGDKHVLQVSPNGQNALAWMHGDDSPIVVRLHSSKETRLDLPEPMWLTTADGQNSRNSVNVVKFANNSSFVAFARVNGFVGLWDSQTGKVLRRLREGGSVVTDLASNNQVCRAFSLAFSPNDLMLATGETNGSITLWNSETGDLLGNLPADSNCDASSAQQLDAVKAIDSLTFSPDGRLLAAVDTYGVIRIWDIHAKTVTHELAYLGGPAWLKVEFSPDSRMLVASSQEWGKPNELLQFWDVETGKLLRATILPGFVAFDFAATGNFFTAQENAGRVKLDEWTADSTLYVPYFSAPKVRIASSESDVLSAYESQALSNLEVLYGALGAYVASTENSGFPHSLQESFKARPYLAQLLRGDYQGYRFTYQPGPMDNQGRIARYTVAARPLLPGQTGVQTFLLDQSGEIHANRVREASLSDPVYRKLQSAPLPIQAETAPPQGQTPQPSQASTVNAAPSQAPPELSSHSVRSSEEVKQWRSRAESQFQQGDYRGAIQSCDSALNIDPNNALVKQLKAKIEETMKILGKN